MQSSSGSACVRPPRSLSTRMQGALVNRVGRISLLLAITLVSILVHGYHMGTDDAAIYAPGIEKAADPSLFPFGSEFFMHHAGLSLFPRLVASITWLTGLPLEWSILLRFAFAHFLLHRSASDLPVHSFPSQ